jgi:hypothetical protein
MVHLVHYNISWANPGIHIRRTLLTVREQKQGDMSCDIARK